MLTLDALARLVSRQRCQIRDPLMSAFRSGGIIVQAAMALTAQATAQLPHGYAPPR